MWYLFQMDGGLTATGGLGSRHAGEGAETPWRGASEEPMPMEKTLIYRLRGRSSRKLAALGTWLLAAGGMLAAGVMLAEGPLSAARASDPDTLPPSLLNAGDGVSTLTLTSSAASPTRELDRFIAALAAQDEALDGDDAPPGSVEAPLSESEEDGQTDAEVGEDTDAAAAKARKDCKPRKRGKKAKDGKRRDKKARKKRKKRKHYCDPDEELKGVLPGEEADHMVVEGEPSEFQKALSDANFLDQFFNDPRYEDEVNFTRLRVRVRTKFREGSAVTVDPETQFRYSLPGAERRFVLLLSGDLDGAVNGDGAASADEQEKDDVKGFLEPEGDEEAVFALQTFLRTTKDLNVSVQTGVRIRDFKPIGFIGPRYRRTFDFEPWALRVTQQARWFSDEGFALRSKFDLERRYHGDNFLRLTANAQWSEEDQEIEYGLNARYFQFLGPREVLLYALLGRVQTEPVHQFDRVVARVSYRRQFYDDLLFVEVAPEVAFLRSRDFDVTPGVMIRLGTVLEYNW